MVSGAERRRESKASSQHALRLLPLAYQDHEAELEFRDSWLQATRSGHRIWTTASAISYAICSLLIGLSAEPGFIADQWFRIWVCLPLQAIALAIVWRARYSDAAYRWLYLTVALCLFFNAIASYAYAHPADARLHLFESALIFVFAQYFYPARWSLIAAFAVIGGTGATVFFVIADRLPGGANVPLEMAVLVTWGMAVAGVSSAYMKEQMARRNFREIMLSRARTAELDTMRAEAERSASAKARFIAIAAHELRTPLNAICGFAELGHKSAMAKRSSDAGHAVYEQLSRDAHHLSNLVESTLTITRDGALSLQSERAVFPVEDMLQQVAAAERVCAREIGVRQYRTPGGSSLAVDGDARVYRTMIESLIRRVRGIPGWDAMLLQAEADGEGCRLVIASASMPTAGDGKCPQPDFLVSGLTASLARSQGVEIRAMGTDTWILGFGIRVPADRTVRLAGAVPVPAEQAC